MLFAGEITGSYKKGALCNPMSRMPHASKPLKSQLETRLHPHAHPGHALICYEKGDPKVAFF